MIHSFHPFSLIFRSSVQSPPICRSKKMGTKNSNSHLFRFLFLLISSATSFISLAESSNITRGQLIKDGQTLISSDQKFELGFFSPVNSSKHYVGIWYYKIPVRTVVWVANRDNPVLDSSGVFTVAADGNLKVLNGQGQSLWSSNILTTNISTTAVFGSDGNLILCRSEEAGGSCRSLWQSFDNPTDTYLPGMKVWWKSRTGARLIYTSWRSENDPSTGNFSMSMDPTGQDQIVVWKGTRRLWRSGLWNGQVFVGIPNMRSSRSVYGFSLSLDNGRDGERYFTYSAFNGEIIRFRLRWDGREEPLRWDEVNKNWTVFWQQSTGVCGIYNRCGASASCNPSGSGNRCNCVKGYVPKNVKEWNDGNWSGGCVRRKKLLCERDNTTDFEEAKPDGFLVVDGVKLPDLSTLRDVSDSREQCEAECLKNCSCKAYARGDGLGCLIWTGDLVDIEEFNDGGHQLYIRVAHSELDKKSKTWKIAVIIAVVFGTMILLTSAYLYWRYRGRVKGLCRKGNTETYKLEISRSREFGVDFSGQHEFGEEENGSAPELPLYTFQSIVTATNNFSKENLLGQGGFGPVYKGKLPCGMEIAVKRLSRQSGQGLTEFQTEVKLIARLQHRNLVRLLGCCIHGEERILLYEYLPNKSLDAFIFDSTNQKQLDWAKRFDIIEGIARGLLYLHRDSRLRVIHRDLKASNILLDEEMNPKISDFGMARIFGGNQNQANTNRLVGTYGYMSPEYAMEGLFSVKSDVYSFGVLLLEIVSGKKNTQYRNLEHSKNLLGYAWKLWNEQNAIELVDPYIRASSCSISDIVRCIHIGLLCVQDSALDRPNMSSVVLMLASETATLPLPREPTFTVGSSIGMDLFLENSEVLTKNDVTVTMTVGR